MGNNNRTVFLHDSNTSSLQHLRNYATTHIDNGNVDQRHKSDQRGGNENPTRKSLPLKPSASVLVDEQSFLQAIRNSLNNSNPHDHPSDYRGYY